MNDLGIQPYDVLMLATLILATIFGAWKGMAWQLASLASVLVSFFVAMHFSGAVAPFISAQEPWNRFTAMLILYLVTSLGIWLLFRLVSKALDRVKLKEFDRQVGAMFGFAKGVALGLVITFFAVTLSETTRQVVLKSQSGHYIALFVQKGAPMVPDDVRAVLGKYIDELDRKLDPKTPADPAPGIQDLPKLPDLPQFERADGDRPADADRSAARPGQGTGPAASPYGFPGDFGPSDRT